MLRRSARFNAAVDSPRALSLIDSFAGLPVAIVGDVMLDHFIFGRVTRISPEAPVPVVEFDREEFRIGGAANVAANTRALGGSVAVAGVVGADEHGATLTSSLRRAGIDPAGILVDGQRPTTRKVRIVTSRHQQVARIDYEIDREIAGDGLDDGLARMVILGPRVDLQVLGGRRPEGARRTARRRPHGSSRC